MRQVDLAHSLQSLRAEAMQELDQSKLDAFLGGMIGDLGALQPAAPKWTS